MFKITADKIDTGKFHEKYKRFCRELEAETRIALVRTREDFLTRVASILGTVPSTGGALPSPYVGFYTELSTGWLTKKIHFHYMMPIGTATGDTYKWLLEHAQNPGEIIKNGESIEIDAGVPRPHDISEGMDENMRSPEAKIYLMEFGGLWFSKVVPARPIFRPAVVWYLTLGMESPFYKECLAARGRAIERVYGA